MQCSIIKKWFIQGGREQLQGGGAEGSKRFSGFGSSKLVAYFTAPPKISNCVSTHAHKGREREREGGGERGR